MKMKMHVASLIDRKQQLANHKTIKRRCCLLAYNDDGNYGTVQPRRWYQWLGIENRRITGRSHNNNQPTTQRNATMWQQATDDAVARLCLKKVYSEEDSPYVEFPQPSSPLVTNVGIFHPSAIVLFSTEHYFKAAVAMKWNAMHFFHSQCQQWRSCRATLSTSTLFTWWFCDEETGVTNGRGEGPIQYETLWAQRGLMKRHFLPVDDKLHFCWVCLLLWGLLHKGRLCAQVSKNWVRNSYTTVW
jgi:hypothetical protein